MDRTSEATKAVDLFGSGKHGYTEGEPGVDLPTVIGAVALNSFQEEICNAIVAGGGTLAAGDLTQLATVINNWKNLSAIFDATITSDAVPSDALFTEVADPDSAYSLSNSDKNIVLPSAGLYLVTLQLVVTCTDTTNPLPVYAWIETGAEAGANRYRIMGERRSATAGDEIIISGSALIVSSDAWIRIFLNNGPTSGSFSTSGTVFSGDYPQHVGVTRLVKT